MVVEHVTCVWDGKVIMFNPNFYACSIISKETWLSCPSKINKCLLIENTTPRANFLKKNKNFMNNKKVIQALFCIAM
jgi:hypothetical protein